MRAREGLHIRARSRSARLKQSQDSVSISCDTAVLRKARALNSKDI
jgi:hypothetical protein